MLNELLELHSSMDLAGIPRDSGHRHYQPAPETVNFFMFIAPGGTASGFEPITDIEKIRSIRKYGVPNTGVSFPAFNMKPLMIARSSRAKDAVKDIKKMFQSRSRGAVDKAALPSRIHSFCDLCEPLWTQGEKDKISKCLASGGLREQLGAILARVPKDLSAISELMRRSAQVRIDKLEQSLKYLIIDGLTRNLDNADSLLNALVASSTNHKVPILLELADHSSFPYPANHPKVNSWVNAMLMELSRRSKVKEVSRKEDAFGWPIADKDLKTKSHPMRLPKLGNVILRAMNEESPCQKRYGRIGPESFPAGEEVQQVMADALTWLAEGERRGKTWQDISNVSGYGRALLFAYPSILHKGPPELAGWFQPSDPDGVRFEAAAARVIPALQGLYNEAPQTEVRIFALAKADQARTKVLVSKNYGVQVLLSGAQVWQHGCKNIPPIKLNVGSKARPWLIKPITPFPAEVVECLNVKWLQGGTRTGRVHGLGIGEGIELLLEREDLASGIVNRALSLATINGAPLLLALGQADHRGDGTLNLGTRYRRHASLLPSLLGLLLYKQNLMKGAYMNTAPFLVGRLLALADVLHKEYCAHVREGGIPPQLLGNALMTSAMENPEKAIARLGERLMIYQAWANTARGEGIGLAKWAVKEMGIASGELVRVNLLDRTSDTDKAQMLLGYLARLDDKASECAQDLANDTDQEVQNEHEN
ncbi:MAG: hypothetical protein HY913_02825 [Desulfomonile tiedjei]|nr:hypothetical protein [Desulfomonile tiedjei]